MTLIITSISKYGIAMVADSAVTKKSGIRREVSNDANKLQFIEHLPAAISMWGMGDMPKSKIATDKWVEDFISRHTNVASLQVFATESRASESLYYIMCEM